MELPHTEAARYSKTNMTALPMTSQEKGELCIRRYYCRSIPRPTLQTVPLFGTLLKNHLGSDTKLRPKAWKAEDDLTAQKDRLYLEVRKLKEEVAEAETVKRYVEQTMPPTEQRKEKSKGHDMSL